MTEIVLAVDLGAGSLRTAAVDLNGRIRALDAQVLGIAEPVPGWAEVDYWALDLETGGLAPGKDPILAVGMVPIREGVVRLAEAYGTIVRPPRDASPPDSAAVATAPEPNGRA